MGQNEQRALWVTVLVLVFSTMALASAPRWAACISSALAVLAVVPLALSRRHLKASTPLIIFILIPLGATVLQLLPLPSEIVHAVAPARYALEEANTSVYGQPVPRLMTLSHDWPSTLVELAKLIGYFAFAYVCLRLAAHRRGRTWLVTTVVVVAGLVALCALGHRALGARTLLGIYEPTVGYKHAISPFLNPNHLAGYMAFGVPVALGLAIHRRSWLLALPALLMVLTALQAVSRGGIISLSVGVVIAMALLAKAHAHQASSSRGMYVGFLLLGVGFVLVAVFGASAGRELLALDFGLERTSGKLLAWASAPSLLETSPWLGIGRGAFEYGFTAFQPRTGDTFSHIENEYIQVALDWGIPVAVAMALSLGLLFRSFLQKPLDALAAGGLGGLAAILVQAFVDFGLAMPGMVLPVIAVAATLSPVVLQIHKDKRKRNLAHRLRIASLVVAMLICAMGASSLGLRPAQDIAITPELSASFRGDAAAILSAGARVSKRHPSSYQVAAAVAAGLWRLRDVRAFAALARALQLNPHHYGVHLLAARMLASSQKPRQAIAEYRAALEIPGGPKREILAALEKDFSSVADLTSAIPTTSRAEIGYGNLLLGRSRADAASALAQRARERGKQPYAIYALGVQAALVNEEFSLAVETGLDGYRNFQTDESLLLYVTALRSASLPLVAINAFTQHPDSHRPSRLDVLAVQSDLQISVGDLVGARASATTLLEAAHVSPKHLGIAHKRLATIENNNSNFHQARWHEQEALRHNAR